MTGVLLIAHGSRDPRAAAATWSLAELVRAARPGLDVRVAFLDHALPRAPAALAALERAGHATATVVPLLLTSAYHGRVDIPAVLAAARAAGLRLPVTMAEVLGPLAGPAAPELVAALRRRLAAVAGVDAVALLAAGTRDGAARRTVEVVGAALAESLGVPVEVGYASGPGLPAATALERLRAAGVRRVGAAAYFLAPGRLYELAAAAARSAGAVAVAEPLGAAPELARLLLARVDAAAAGGQSFRAVSGPVIRSSTGRVDAMMPRAAASPARTTR